MHACLCSLMLVFTRNVGLVILFIYSKHDRVSFKDRSVQTFFMLFSFVLTMLAYLHLKEALVSTTRKFNMMHNYVGPILAPYANKKTLG